MNLAYENRHEAINFDHERPKTSNDSVLKTWILANSGKTVAKYLELEKSQFKKPLTFSRMFLTRG